MIAPVTQKGLVVVSIENHATGTSLAGQQRVILRLNAFLSERSIPITWFSRYQAFEDLQVISDTLVDHHEVAIIADHQWCSSNADRKAFNEELTKRSECLQDLGVGLSTVAIDDELPEDSLDILVKQRISLVRDLRDSSSAAVRGLKPFSEESKRYGIWRLPPPYTLTELTQRNVRTVVARRQMVKQLHRGNCVHVNMRLSQIMDTAGWKRAAILFDQLKQMRDRGRIQIFPVNSLCYVARRVVQNSQSHSDIRPAA